MNKTTARWLWTMAGVGAVAVSLCFGEAPVGAQPTALRRAPTDVILADWQGKWDCNMDGRQTTLLFNLLENRRCLGSLCQSAFKISGRMLDARGLETPLEPRDYGYGDPPSARVDHLLPLSFRSDTGELPMLLIMHTGNRENASGYVLWNGIPFGLQCRKTNALSAGKSLTKKTEANIIKESLSHSPQ